MLKLTCTPTQNGYNVFWNKTQTARLNIHKTCICGQPCHKSEAIKQMKDLIIVIDHSQYVEESLYSHGKEWQEFSPYFIYPKDIVDIKTGTKLTHEAGLSRYYNHSNDSTYYLTRWRYTYDQR